MAKNYCIWIGAKKRVACARSRRVAERHAKALWLRNKGKHVRVCPGTKWCESPGYRRY